MIWFLWTAGIGVGLVAVTAILVLRRDAATHRRAERRRVSEYLARLADDDEALYRIDREAQPWAGDMVVHSPLDDGEWVGVLRQVWPVDD